MTTVSSLRGEVTSIRAHIDTLEAAVLGGFHDDEVAILVTDLSTAVTRLALHLEGGNGDDVDGDDGDGDGDLDDLRLWPDGVGAIRVVAGDARRGTGGSIRPWWYPLDER